MEEQITLIGLIFQQRTLKAGSSYTKDVVASTLKEFKGNIPSVSEATEIF